MRRLACVRTDTILEMKTPVDGVLFVSGGFTREAKIFFDPTYGSVGSHSRVTLRALKSSSFPAAPLQRRLSSPSVVREWQTAKDCQMLYRRPTGSLVLAGQFCSAYTYVVSILKQLPPSDLYLIALRFACCGSHCTVLQGIVHYILVVYVQYVGLRSAGMQSANRYPRVMLFLQKSVL